MESSGKSQSSNIDEASKKSKSSRAPKGKVYMDKLTVLRNNGIKKDVHFNSNGQPIGPEGSEMQSYIGVLARRHIKVSFPSWPDVPPEPKNLIWDSVKLVFNVDERWKTGCFKSANDKWRQWKSTLYTKYIEPFDEMPEMLLNPPPDSGIRKEDWKDFVNLRRTEEARIKSAELKKRRRNNLYDHHMSRKGYAGLREEMKDKLTGNPAVDRAIIWRQGRANKDGEFDEVTKPTVEKLDKILELHKEAEFSQSHPTDDILTQALEKPEHSGRVRGVGAYVTPTTYFSLKSGTSMGIEKVVEEIKRDFGKQLQELGAKFIELQEQVMIKKEVEEKGSCSNKNMSVNLENELDVVEVPHDSVSRIIKVSRSKEKVTPDNLRKLKATDIPQPLKMLNAYAKLALPDGKSIQISIDSNVFGHDQTCFIFFDDIHRFCELEPITGTCICVFSWLLYKECENSNLLERFRFINPYQISHNDNVSGCEKAIIIGTRLIGILPNQFALVPCNVGWHWILMIIDPHNETVFFLDPLSDEAHVGEWKDIMDTAIKMFNSTIRKRGRQFILWEKITCQQQPDGK